MILVYAIGSRASVHIALPWRLSTVCGLAVDRWSEHVPDDTESPCHRCETAILAFEDWLNKRSRRETP